MKGEELNWNWVLGATEWRLRMLESVIGDVEWVDKIDAGVVCVAGDGGRAKTNAE